MKPFDHTSEFANAIRVYTKADVMRLERKWIKVNGKLECRYEMKAVSR